MYRLFIDLDCGEEVEGAIEKANVILQKIISALKEETQAPQVVKARLSHDFDRGNKNYLDMNENGHCSTQKTVYKLTN